MRAATLGLAASVVLSACAGGSELSGDLRNVGGVTMTFTVAPPRIQLGQSVRVALRLVNNSGREERLTFPSGQRYDFWVTNEGREVWRWSDDLVFTAAITHETIAAQTSLVLSERWTPEAAGSYTVHGELKAQGYGDDLAGELVVE